MKSLPKISLVAAAVVLLPTVAVQAQGSPADSVVVDAQPRLLALEAARDYLEKSRYPEHSKALPADSIDPLRDERKAHPVTVKGRALPGTSLSVWSSQLSYRPGERMVFYAVAAGFEPAAILGEMADSTGAFTAELVFHDDGAGADEIAGDGVYSTRAMVPKRLAPELAEAYRVSVDAALDSGETLTATTGFVFSNPWADLTGEYRDAIVEGNLVIEARVRVRQAGRFHLSGVLHALDGEPIGTAQNALELEPGVHWIPLEFYGLMFHDRQVKGPVKLGSLALTTTGGMPNAIDEIVVDAHVVRGLKAASFHAEPYDNPADLDAAQRLEADGLRSLKARER